MRTCIWLRRHEIIKIHWEVVPVSGNPAANVLKDLSGTMSRVRGVYSQHAVIIIKTQHVLCDRQMCLTRTLIYVASDVTRQTKRCRNDRLLELLALHAALGADVVTWMKTVWYRSSKRWRVTWSSLNGAPSIALLGIVHRSDWINNGVK